MQYIAYCQLKKGFYFEKFIYGLWFKFESWSNEI